MTSTEKLSNNGVIYCCRLVKLQYCSTIKGIIVLSWLNVVPSIYMYKGLDYGYIIAEAFCKQSILYLPGLPSQLL